MSFAKSRLAAGLLFLGVVAIAIGIYRASIRTTPASEAPARVTQPAHAERVSNRTTPPAKTPVQPSARHQAKGDSDLHPGRWLTVPQATIFNSSNVASAIRQAREKYGQSDELSYAERFAATACASDPDPTGSISAHTTDPLRAWAIARMLDQCKDMESLPPASGKIQFVSPAMVAKQRGIQAGRQAAMQVIQSSNEIPELYEAGQVLVENGLLPTASIAGLNPNLGAPDLIKDWLFAAELWNCDYSGGCGPDNFRTVAYCSSAGCLPGSDLRSALNATLSVRDMQAVNALYQWIADNR